MSHPILFIFSGLPGVGKSTLAIQLSKHFGATYLRVDAIEQGLKDECGLTIYVQGYLIAYRLAADNLKHGLSVVGDSCNSVMESRKAWQQVAIDSQAKFINIEVVCSDQNEHQQRVESRQPAVDGLRLPAWQEVQNREYQPWPEQVISIDTARQTPEQSFEALLAMLTDN